MHEASIAGGVLRLVEEAAQKERFSRLLELRLEVGALAGVDVHALRFALECLGPGSLLEGARIEIVEPPGRAWCLACSQTVTVRQHGDACPSCGSYQLQVTEGTALRVLDMRVSDD